MPESPSAQTLLPAIAIASCLVPTTTGFPAPFEGMSEGFMAGENSVSIQEEARDEPRRCRSGVSLPPQLTLTEPV